MTTTPLAIGRVEALCLNGLEFGHIECSLEGPIGDRHAGFSRKLSGHDGAYIRASDLEKGAPVFNWRTWTGLSKPEVEETELILGCTIPLGCLLENFIFSGIPDFSKLVPTTRLVFPMRAGRQAILAVWEENGPCKTVAQRLAEHYQDPGLKPRFITAMQNKRGVMGIVLAPGEIELGDEVSVFPPVR